MELPNLPGLVGALFAAVPAMVLLYVLLNRYDTFFNERRLLMALLVGLLAGAAVTMVEVLLLGFHQPGLILGTNWQVGLIQLVVFYSLLETLGKFIPANWHAYRGRRDTPYYAVGIGVGFAAINAFILVARGVVEFMQTAAPELTHAQIALFAVVTFLLFVGGIMTQGFTTVIMGQAVADRDSVRAFIYSAAFLMPYYVGYWALSRIVDNPTMGIIVTLLVFLYGAIGVVQVRKRILDHVVPPKEARRLRREMRKEALGKSGDR